MADRTDPMDRRRFLKTGGAVLGAAALSRVGLAQPARQRPDVLFIAIEDVSPHRFGCYGNTVCKTPYMDRFAAQGLRFTEAHTIPPCCPSRTQLFLGLRPETTKVHGNRDDWRKLIPDAVPLPQHFRTHGYETVRCGKMFHGGSGRGAFETPACWGRVVSPREGMPKRKHTRRPPHGPGVEYSKRRREARKQGKDLPGGSPFTYGPSGLDDMEEVDGMVAEQGIRLLNAKQDKPLLLALGFHATHLPFIAPDRYFEPYPAQDMVLPKNPGSDANGMPTKGKLNPLNPHTPEQWRDAIAAHYACLTFIDAQVGRVLEALDKSGRGENTIVVVWSDHGFMLGEHFMWRKGALRDESTMCALMMRAPGVTTAGSVCQRPVESIDIFPTLLDLCGVPMPERLEATSMRPLLADPTRPWKKGALMGSGKRGRSICTERWRYNEYAKRGKRPGRAELFDQQKDPGEFQNLAQDPQHGDVKAELSRLLQGGWRACLPSAP